MGEVVFGVDFKASRKQAPITRNLATAELLALDLYNHAMTGAPPDVLYESSLGYVEPKEPA